MKSISINAMALAFALTSAASFAADPVEHAEHHPEKAAAPAPTAKATKASGEQMIKMDAQMKSMRDIHEKMMAAKTPEERKLLMAEHMKTMHEGMQMMNGMMTRQSADKSAMPPQMMQKQMGMMQMEMQMMMDHMAVHDAAK